MGFTRSMKAGTTHLMRFVSDHDLASLAGRFCDWGINPAHAPRLLRALYRDGAAANIAALKLGRLLEERLAEELPTIGSSILNRNSSADGTIKLLLGMARGGAVETVLMPAYREDRAAGCVSSQVGCAMGCDFCASARNGLERSLEAGEIVEQFLHLQSLARADGRRLASLVYMGMGEPMHNLDAVMESIRRINTIGSLGARRITVSTVGIVPGIQRLAESGLGVHLALSLHAPDDGIRAAIVPTSRRYKVAEIVASAREYQQSTGRIVTIEYTLLAGVNDSDEQAGALAELLVGFRAHVNLIPYNPIGLGLSGRSYIRPAPERVSGFLKVLHSHGVVAHVRRTRGDDVAAACGQLAGIAAAEA